MSVVLCEGLHVHVWEGAYKQYTYICNTYLVLLMESVGIFFRSVQCCEQVDGASQD